MAQLDGGSPLSWGEDGNILVSTPTGIQRIPAAGGKPEIVATADAAKGEPPYHYAELLPGGRSILANATTSAFGGSFQVTAIDAKTGGKKVLIKDASGDAWFAPTGTKPGVGHLVYGDGRTLFAAPLDANSLELGPAAPVLEGIGGPAGGVFGFSRSGTLVYRPEGGIFSSATPVLSTLAWVDRQGVEQPLQFPPAAYQSPRLSPDGGRVAIGVRESGASFGGAGFTGPADLWVYELARAARAKVTFGGNNTLPIWMPGGTRLIYRHSDSDQSTPATLSVAADGSAPLTLWKGLYAPYSISRGVLIASTPPRRVDSSTSEFKAAGGAPERKQKTANSKGVTVRGRGGGLRPDNQLWLLKLGPDGKPSAGEPERFLDARFFHTNAAFSPDGRWIAFQSNQNQVDEFEIYVAPYPGPGPVIPVSSGGGDEPHWNSNGRELFYRSGDKVMAVDVATAGAAFRVTGSPRVLFEKASLGYDVAPNGQRFLMLKPRELSQNRAPEFHVILNWFEELRRLVPLQ